MMSRSRILASLSSSRQMMMAWKVSGLSHRPAIIASRPASMRLAMAISPSRESSSTEPMSRRYMRTGSSVRSVGSARVCGDGRQALRGDRDGRLGSSSSAASSPSWRGGRLLGLLALDHGDAHVGQHRHGVLDLVGGHLLGGQHGIERVIGDVAARLGGLDELLDRRIGQVEKRAVLLRAPRTGVAAWSSALRCHCHSITPGHAAAAQRAEEKFTSTRSATAGRAEARHAKRLASRRHAATLAGHGKPPVR